MFKRMTTLKRYLLALAGFLVTGAAVGGLSDLLVPLFASSPTRIPLEEIDIWQKRILFRHNAVSAVSNLLSFAAGAFLLRRNPLIPGLVLYFALAIPAVKILHSIAVPADPEITYLGILAANPQGWIVSFVAALAGMAAGHLIARSRATDSDAIQPVITTDR